MASDMAKAAADTTRTPSQHDHFILKQLGRMSRQVKLVDLIGSLMILLVGLLAYFLAVAVVDHWILPLGIVGRSLAFLLMVGGIGYYLVAVVAPLLVHRINPAFAARAIERSQPTLKNSLVNFLMFRSQPVGVRAAVYEALEQRAAGDLSHVDLETVVDRSKLIVIGYVLAGVFALVALYSVLSPKSAVQSVSRVVMPWADVARPSRVAIDEVTPGDTTVVSGRHVEVSARITGLREGESATLYFTTADGQSVDRPVSLRWDSSDRLYHGLLPPESGGVQQQLRYRLQAGDTETGDFLVRVQAEPTMLVERVEYEYPAYTKRPKAVVERQGDLQALEGTRVTIHASANYEIGSARIEFDPVIAGGETKSAARQLSMTADGKSAQASFHLKLDGSRRAAEHPTYQLRFVTADGQASQYPTLHQIQVTPDLPPEIEVLAPTKLKVEVPEDGRQPIEVRAIDPDYGLTRVTLRAVVGGEKLLDVPLLDDDQGRVGQSVSTYTFEPRRLKLIAGTRVTFWATAEDNRTAPDTGSPDPNTARTRNYEIEVVPAKTRPRELAEDEAEDEQDPSGQGTRPQPDPSAEGSDSGESQDGTSDESDSQDNGNSDMADADADSDSESGTENGKSDGEEKDGPNQGGSAGESGEQTSEQTGDQSGTASGESGGESDGDSTSGGDGSPSGEASGDGAAENQGGDGRGTSGSDDGSARGDGDSRGGGDPSAAGQDGHGDGPQRPLHDGEIIERIEQFRKQQQARDATPEGQGGEGTSGDPSGQDRDTEGSDYRSSASDPSADSPQGTGGSRTPGDENEKPLPQGADPQGSDPSTGRSPADSDRAGDAGAQGDDRDHGAGESNDGNAGDGGKPQGPMETEKSEPAQRDQDTGERSKPGLGDSGDSGAGSRSENDQGATESQEDNRDRQKEKQPDSSAPESGNEAQSPTTSKRQSDSEGGEAGDRSGGGKQGGGQGANQPGNDSAGSNSVADEGAGAAQEQGMGETGEQAGDQQTADDQTGNAGDQRGDGSASQSGDGSQSGGADAGPNASSTPPSPNERDPSDPSPQEHQPGQGGRRPGGGGVPTGGGIGGSDDGHAGNLPEDVPDGDEANLEYTRQATDLVLDYLESQKDQPDRRLLDELGWTDEDLRKFVDRWKQLKQTADATDEGQRELDDTLRSLGLRPETTRLRQGSASNDAMRDLRDSGTRSAPPARYRDLFDAFRKGTARSER